MQLALTVDCSHDRDLIFVQQLGVGHVIASVTRWEETDLSGLRNRVEQTGLELVAVESLPTSLYADAILGLADAGPAIDAVCQAIRRIGDAGIPMVGYRWTPPSLSRTARTGGGRGGPMVGSYDHALVRAMPSAFPQPTTSDAMWENLSRFLERVVPVAEEANVRLAFCLDDPPVQSLGGVPRIAGSVQGLDRILEIADSPDHGVDLSLGTVAAMADEDPVRAIRHFGGQDKLFMVHLRNVRGKVPVFTDTFLDEGDVVIPRALLACRSVGFAGPIRAATPPGMVGDTEWGHKGRAHDLGYLRALLQVLEGLPESVVGASI